LPDLKNWLEKKFIFYQEDYKEILDHFNAVKKNFTFEIFNNHFTKCVFAYPYSPMYPYYDPIGVGKVNKLFYWLTGGFPSEEGLNRVGSWNHPL
jgi:hypothetical protein